MLCRRLFLRLCLWSPLFFVSGRAAITRNNFAVFHHPSTEFEYLKRAGSGGRDTLCRIGRDTALFIFHYH